MNTLLIAVLASVQILSSEVTDTVRFTYHNHPLVKIEGRPLAVVDGELMPESFNPYTDIDPRQIYKRRLFTDSLTCARYGGRRATEMGLFFIITKSKAGEILMPTPDKGAKTASYSVYAKASEEVSKQGPTWTVSGEESLDAIPTFGAGNLDSFSRWQTEQIFTDKTNRYSPGPPYNSENYGDTTVSFIITESGQVTDVKILKERGPEFNQCVLRLISDSPSWKPSVKDGKPVPVVVIYPVNCIILVN